MTMRGPGGGERAIDEARATAYALDVVLQELADQLAEARAAVAELERRQAGLVRQRRYWAARLAELERC